MSILRRLSHLAIHDHDARKQLVKHLQRRDDPRGDLLAVTLYPSHPGWEALLDTFEALIPLEDQPACVRWLTPYLDVWALHKRRVPTDMIVRMAKGEDPPAADLCR